MTFILDTFGSPMNSIVLELQNGQLMAIKMIIRDQEL